MNGLSLFSGMGIGELAFRRAVPDYRTVGYVETDQFCQEVIRQRVADGALHDAPIFGDIREFNARFAGFYSGKVDFMSAGFPCQPYSHNGAMSGQADPRNLWPATRDAIGIIRPRFVFLENVANIINHEYVWSILADLASLRYGCEWDVVGAAFVGCPQARSKSWYLLAEADGYGRERIHQEPGLFPAAGEVDQIASGGGGTDGGTDGIGDAWKAEPDLGRVADGVANRVDRLRALGNGWIPQLVAGLLRYK